MKILVLGGTGAMGTYLIKLLADDENNEIYVTSRIDRISEQDNITYIKGDAHSSVFRYDFLNGHFYDVIVDFMYYGFVEFKEAYLDYLEHSRQYIFISSARVYADSEERITEKSARLLDVCQEKAYLDTDEYALEKAREENMLMSQKEKNWTIIRPYITYGNERFQLGILEKEAWLYRGLNGKPIVAQNDVMQKYTTMTCGADVAFAIKALCGNKDAFGEIYTVVSDEEILWRDVLNIYIDLIHRELGIKIEVVFQTSSEDISKVMSNHWQLKYDRLYHRKFDNRKIKEICPDLSFISARKGLERCLLEFIRGNHEFHHVNAALLAYMDIVSKSKHANNELPYNDMKDKIRYRGMRNTPYLFFRTGCRYKK